MGKRKILIVDDDEKVRKIIEEYAIFKEYDVAHATNGIQAIDYCKNNKCDVVTMDVVMPHLDGFTACREIRKISDVPIIMISARMDNFDKIHGYEVGADDYMVKPVSPKILFLKIEAIFKRMNMANINHNEL
ncbi:MAG: response regulator, partial [Clostridia bacterium]|nr:response regulator [Clostridia bacterium]